MELNIQKITPSGAEGIENFGDRYLPPIDAVKRRKLKFKALSRFNYPGNFLTEDTEGIYSIGYWDAVLPQDWGLDWHRNEALEIHFLESGKMAFAQQDQEMELLPNSLTITKPWEMHKVGNPAVGMGKFYWLMLDLKVKKPHQNWIWPDWIVLTPKDLEKLTDVLKQNKKTCWRTDKRIKACFQNIGIAVATDNQGSNASKIRLLVNDLLLLLLDLLLIDVATVDEEITNSSKNVQLFLAKLEANLSENWSVKKMAKSAGVGITQFTYHCKQLTNLTPKKYLMLKRIELSKTILLEKPDFNISDVAYLCGFSTSQYFATIFRKHEKCSPINYRKRAHISV